MAFSTHPYIPNSADEGFMKAALALARQAGEQGEVPIGAILTMNGQQIAHGYNCPIAQNDPTAHAEILAIRQACAGQGNYRLGAQTTLYVTLMPCAMCLGAILHARVGRLVVASRESRFSLPLSHFSSQTDSAWGHCQVECGCLESESQTLLRDFFEDKRSSREESLAALKELTHLPNVSPAVAHWLVKNGFETGADFLAPDLPTKVQQLDAKRAADCSLNPQDDAMLRALCHYLRGQPVVSWRQFIESRQ